MINDIQIWQNKTDLDIELRYELDNLNEQQIYDAFYKDIEFGTGGLRALLGVGTNRLNVYTIRKNTEGYANYIENQGKQAKEQGVVIAYDNRKNSQRFAIETAKVLAAHKIKIYLFDSLRPTPELSFAIRELNAFGGIVITASHNPKEYNGYKIYNSTGCQCVPNETDCIIEYINSVNDLFDINIADTEVLHNYLYIIGNEIDKLYIDKIKQIQFHPELEKKDLKIVFSPQHGTGNILIRRLFNELGYNITPVISQCYPDPNFSNTKSPNPENISAFNEGISIAKEINADAVFSTDPDSDRIGVVVLHNNEYIALSGNQTGAILLYYILTERKKINNLPKNGIVFNTIVTSDLGSRICNSFDIEVESTLTGFKYIGEKINNYEKTQIKEFLFGYEESYGYLVDPMCRDKDGIQASVLLVEAINYYKKIHMDLIDVLDLIYDLYGYEEDYQQSIKLEGKQGKERINEIMDYFRNGTLDQLGGNKIFEKEDYYLSLRYSNGKSSALNLPKSNVIKFKVEDGSWVVIRPSGTEPKIKVYYNIRKRNKLNDFKKDIEKIINM